MRNARGFNGTMRIGAVIMAAVMAVTSIPFLSTASVVYAAEDDTFILPGAQRPGNNIAPEASDISVSFCSPEEKKEAVNDGVYSQTSIAAKDENCDCWGTWDSTHTSGSETVTYIWNEAVLIDSTGIYLWYDSDGQILLPKSYTFEYLNSEGNYVEISNANGLGCEPDGFNITTFDPVESTSFRVTLEKQADDNRGVGVIEWEVYAKNVLQIEQLQSMITKAEEELSGNYTEESLNNLRTVLEEARNVLANGNALQSDVDRAKENLENAINALQALSPLEPDKTELQNTIKEYENLKKEDYTTESWEAYEKVLNEAVQINNDPNATEEQVVNILKDLKAAYDNLLKLSEILPAKGSIHTVGKGRYKVTKSSATSGTVTYYRPLKETYKFITIPDTVEINGYTFKVTKVAIKACYKNTNLVRVVISENVKTIYKGAFSGCTKLKIITFKGKLVTKINKNAFKNVNKKAVFNIIYGKKNAYKKLLLNAGAKTSMTFNIM